MKNGSVREILQPILDQDMDSHEESKKLRREIYLPLSKDIDPFRILVVDCTCEECKP